MKRIPIIVVAALFVVLVGLLAAMVPPPPVSDVGAEKLTLGTVVGEGSGDEAGTDPVVDPAGLSIVIDRPKKPGSEGESAEPETPESADPLAAAQPPQADSGRDRIELEYLGDRWMMKQPVPFPAVGSDVTRLLTQIAKLELIEVPGTRALADLQLDEAQGIRLTVSRGRQALLDLIVGKSTPEGRTFVRKPDDSRIWTVAGLSRSELERPADDLRDKQVFEVDPATVTALTVERGSERSGGRRQFVKQGEAWAQDPPDPRWIADPAKVAGAVSTVGRLRAVGFGDGIPVEATGLGGMFASARITFVAQSEGRSATTYELVVGAADAAGENYYVKRTDAAAPADTVYVVSKYTIDRLIGGEEKGLNEYREGRVVRDVAFESVQGVTVTLRGGRYTFDRGTAVDEWVAAEGNPIGAPDGVSLSAAVRLITTLRADDFLNIPGLQLGDRPIPLKELIDSFPSVIRGATSQEGGGSVAELELANVLTQNLMFIEQMASLYAVVYPESVPVAAQALRDLAGELSGTFVSLRDPILSLAARLVVPPGTVPVAWTFRLEGERRVTLRIGGLTPDGKRPVTTDVEGDEQVYLVAADALGDLALGDPNDLRKPRLLAGIPADRLVSLDYVDEARRWQFVRGGDGVWTAVQAEGISGFDPEKLAATVRRVLDLEAVKFVGLAPAQAGLEPAPVTLVLRWTGEAPPAEEGQPAPEPPVLERLIALGGTDAEGGRYVRLGGSEVDDLLASGVFLVSQAAALDLVLQPSELSASATAEAPLPDATPDTQFLQMFGGGPAPAPPPAP